ncbi:MAG: helix-turn-helix domain-containing protein [Pseudomonadota bacterium]
MYSKAKRSLKFEPKLVSFNEQKTKKFFEIKIDSFLTVPELAKWLNLKESAIYNLVYYRRIPFNKIGRRLRFNKNEVQQWLDASGGKGNYVYQKDSY